MTYARKVDRNHGDMKAFFEAHGCVVESLAHAGRGIPDLLCGYAPTGKVAIVEVKHGKGKLRAQQERFKAKFPMTFVVRDDVSALTAILWLKREESR